MLAAAQAGGIGVLPDPMAAGEGDRQDREIQRAGEGDGAAADVDLDAEDAALGEEGEALAGGGDGGGGAEEGAVGAGTLLGPNDDLAGVAEVGAEEGPTEELVADDEAEGEGELEEGEGVGEALVEGGDDVGLLGVDQVEAFPVDAEGEGALDPPGPPALVAGGRASGTEAPEEACGEGSEEEPEGDVEQGAEVEGKGRDADAPAEEGVADGPHPPDPLSRARERGRSPLGSAPIVGSWGQAVGHGEA